MMINHGGSGTIQDAIRANVPSFIIATITDQP